MELCSLEDDECSNLFITQEPSQLVPLVPKFDAENGFYGDSHQKYSDISDAEDFELPASQVQHKSTG